jgi:hypothetical protein
MVGFACVWAIANLFHQAAWPGRHSGTGMYLLTLLGILVLLRPRALPLFLALLVMQVGMVVHQLPHRASNHWVLTGLVALTILLCWATIAVRRRTLHVSGGELFTAFAPAARLQLLLLYFFAVLHKLNADFLSAATSCGAEHAARLASVLPGLAAGPALEHGAIWGTLAVEAAIPILLVPRRTRLYGLALGVVFHLLLVFDLNWVFYDFSALIYALFFLFVADLALRAVDGARTESGLAARAFRWATSDRVHAVVRAALVAMAVTVVLGAIYGLATGKGPGSHPGLVELIRHLPRPVFVLYALAAAVLWLLMRRHDDGDVRSGPAPGLRPTAVGALMVAVVALNGFAPYLGLKTTNAFSMFSNLRTEGGRTNHLFIPPQLQVAGYQRDLVAVVESSAPALQRAAERGYLLTFFEFRHLTAASPGHSVRFVRNGVEYAVSDVAVDPVLARPIPTLERKALQFRRIEQVDGATACTH